MGVLQFNGRHRPTAEERVPLRVRHVHSNLSSCVVRDKMNSQHSNYFWQAVLLWLRLCPRNKLPDLLQILGVASVIVVSPGF